MNAMYYSIENRSPFLDKNLFKYLTVPNQYKFKKGFNKYLLRNIIDSMGQKQIAWRKTKKGFTNYGHKQILKDQRSKDFILDNAFIKSFINRDYLEKNFENSSFANSSLLAIAALSYKYNLSL